MIEYNHDAVGALASVVAVAGRLRRNYGVRPDATRPALLAVPAGAR